MDVADILADLDDHGFADTPVARKMAVINETYWDITGREPWPFLEKWVRLAFSGTSDQSSNLPSDFNAVISMEHEDQGVVKHVRLDDFEARYGASIDPYVSPPRIFYFIGEELHFFPWPGAEDRVRMAYISTPPALTETSVEADVLIPKQYHRGLLVHGALYRLYAMEDDMELSAGFERFYEQNLMKVREFMSRKQYQRPQIITPVDPDDLGWE